MTRPARNWVLLLALLGAVVLVYGLTILRLKQGYAG